MGLRLSEATLYDFAFSSSSYRIRIALHLKGLEPAHISPVALREGAHLAENFIARSGLAAVPVLDFGDKAFGQSLALIEWLDATAPEPRLIPENPDAALAVRGLAYTIACEIHPLNVPRVLKYLTGPLTQSEDARQKWYTHWVHEGFTTLERQLAHHGHGPFCVGEAPTLADICLVPQVLNARRFGVPTDGFKRIEAIYDTCLALEAFRDAAPEPAAALGQN